MSNELAIKDDTSTAKKLVDMATEWSEHNGSTHAGKKVKTPQLIMKTITYSSPLKTNQSKAFIFIYCIQKPTDEDSSQYGQA